MVVCVTDDRIELSLISSSTLPEIDPSSLDCTVTLTTMRLKWNIQIRFKYAFVPVEKDTPDGNVINIEMPKYAIYVCVLINWVLVSYN